MRDWEKRAEEDRAQKERAQVGVEHRTRHRTLIVGDIGVTVGYYHYYLPTLARETGLTMADSLL